MQVALLFALSALLGCCSTGPVVPTVEDKPKETIPALVAEINAYRATRGLPALTYSPELQKAAQRHADDMASRGFFSHTGSDGSTFVDRANAAGFSMRGGGEIIAMSGRPAEAVSDWKGSSGHHAQMLTTDKKYIGAALSGSRAVAVFGNK